MADDAFDIDEIRATDTEELVINHPATGEPTTWVWTLAGPGHPASIKLADEQARDANRLNRNRIEAATNRRKWKEPEQTTDEIRRDNASAFARRVLGWTPARINKRDYPFSVDNAMNLLIDPAYGRVYQQLLDYFSSESSFIKRSGTALSASPSETSN